MRNHLKKEIIFEAAAVGCFIWSIYKFATAENVIDFKKGMLLMSVSVTFAGAGLKGRYPTVGNSMFFLGVGSLFILNVANEYDSANNEATPTHGNRIEL